MPRRHRRAPAPPPPSAPTDLVAGPYRAPRCRPGKVLACTLRGDVTVAGLTDAPVPWPYAAQAQGGGKPLLILAGDLERAVRAESVAAVCHHWGCGRKLVWRWRAALGVGRMTDGTRRRWSALAAGKFGRETTTKGEE
jgi:hypothetical protein